MTRLTVDAIDHIVFNVCDVEVSAAWYELVLGMTRQVLRAPSGEMRTSVSFGRNKINLRPVTAATETWFTAGTACAGCADVCFLTSASPDDVVAHFQECGVTMVLGPVTKSGAMGPIQSVYVRDPDGNLVEVASYSSA